MGGKVVGRIQFKRELVYTEAYLRTERTDIKIGWDINRGYHGHVIADPELYVVGQPDPQEVEFYLDQLIENMGDDFEEAILA